MQTETLIAQLAGGVRTVRPHAALRRLYAAVMIGAVVAFGLLLFAVGLRADIGQASHTAPFWMKWVFTLSLVAASVVVARRLGDPDSHVGLAWWIPVAPIAIVGMMALGELMEAPVSARGSLILGRTYIQCLVAIPLLAVPVFLSLILAFRRLAPTRLRLAGAASGFLAGATAASVYALACPEQTAAFMVTWYTVGMAIPALVGAAVGSRLLRW